MNADKKKPTGEINCEHCKNTIQITLKNQGRTIECPTCNKQVNIPLKHLEIGVFKSREVFLCVCASLSLLFVLLRRAKEWEADGFRGWQNEC